MISKTDLVILGNHKGFRKETKVTEKGKSNKDVVVVKSIDDIIKNFIKNYLNFGNEDEVDIKEDDETVVISVQLNRDEDVKDQKNCIEKEINLNV